MSLDEASDIATMSEQSTDHEENESESELESEREEATSGSETEDSDDAMQDVPEKKRRRVRTTDNAADFAAGLDRVLSMSMNKQEIQASSHCRGCSSMRACVYLLAGSANPLFLVVMMMITPLPGTGDGQESSGGATAGGGAAGTTRAQGADRRAQRQTTARPATTGGAGRGGPDARL
ncbi:hypothetical protein SYNPS1DRAFT_32086 [Syncephalis pseudoplumigaleata]|uniref:Uncharacterized protein n=1 Tax=Syncephalis pseudoplumigaleata TaxID=1712513 RepID=A0A4P9YR48_9FUNG|nr:hypothetical protein SYNPS1DRAFT_32086 [Syncephalis pseudoplumigaleata]|eukprot:RKP22333.1 hypothetical protein SYNPS1DRAFT_32086 [Syncephalis pseudoplumigaleata]